VKFDEKDALATCDCDTDYLEATLHFNVPKIINLKPDLEELVVHELSHPFNWRLWDYVNQFINGNKAQEWITRSLFEEATTRIGNSLVDTKKSLEKQYQKQ